MRKFFNIVGGLAVLGIMLYCSMLVIALAFYTAALVIGG